MSKISLLKWGARYDPMPHINTLRAWAKDGLILPKPAKLGRAYYVDPKAKHIDEIMAEATNGTIPL